jgi:hypothetical protein
LKENKTVSYHGSVGLSLAVLALAAGPPAAPTYCDAELLHIPKSPTSYQVRGDRCEGIYAQQVSTVSVDLRSFVEGFGAFDPQTQTTLELAWKAPAGIAGMARLRAFSLKPRIYYRMDTAQPAATGSYRWPTEILAGEELGRDDLGIVAWVEMPGPAGRPREVYLPLRAGGPQTLDGYEVTLFPSKKLKQILLTVVQIDGEGNEVKETAVKNKDVGGELAYYGSNEPTVLATGKLGAPGFYRLEIKAIAASGDAVIKEIDFYHAGD